VTDEQVSSTSPSLFRIDLGGNGGTFSPITLEDAQAWVEKERAFWRQIHRNVLPPDHPAAELSQGWEAQMRIARERSRNGESIQGQLEALKDIIVRTFSHRKLPHSSSPDGQRVASFFHDRGPDAGATFATVMVAQLGATIAPPRNLEEWHGFMEAIAEKFRRADSSSRPEGSSEEAFEILRAKAEHFIGEKTEKIERLQNSFESLETTIAAMNDTQEQQFIAGQATRGTGFDELLAEHKAQLAGIRQAYMEEMGLRAPAEYWETKRRAHLSKVRWFGNLSFLAIVGAASVSAWQVSSLLRGPNALGRENSWELAPVVIVGIFLVWGVRLLVRLFLSNLHLSTDAEERVVMVKTYLSLAEGKQLEAKEDRQLILQALFRSSADGIVKDEALPPTWIDLVTRK
jgi:hypothetical protein